MHLNIAHRGARSLAPENTMAVIKKAYEIAAGRISREERAAFCGEKISTLEEGLAFTKANHWPVNLEMKTLAPPVTDFPQNLKRLHKD